MKRIIKKIGIICLIAALPMLSVAQPPAPNTPGNTSGASAPGSGNKATGGGSAPIDGGLSIFVILALGYGSKKVLKLKQIKPQE